MRTRTWQYDTRGLRGLPAVLVLVLLAALIIGVVALAVFVGLAVAVIGLAASAAAALFFAIQRRLARPPPPAEPSAEPEQEQLPAQSGEIREIKVDQIIVRRDD